jgi:hypothetical protein
MTQPHQIDREAVAALIERLRENLSDSAPSRLVCVESADVQSALDTIEALSRPMEAVAWREKVADAAYVVLRHSDYRPGTDNGLIPHDDRVVPLAIADAIIQALAVIPTQGGEGHETEGKG